MMKKFNRPINDGFYWGTWKIDITKATMNKKYVQLLAALRSHPFISKYEAYAEVYGSYLNAYGTRFSQCIWSSLRKSGLIEEFLDNKKHVYALSDLGEECVECALSKLKSA